MHDQDLAHRNDHLPTLGSAGDRRERPARLDIVTARCAAALGELGCEADDAALLAIVPLVRVAWAENRVTRRERETIFRVAEELGVPPGGGAHRRLAGWLEAEPTPEFYELSFSLLRASLRNLSAAERAAYRAELARLAGEVARASGGCALRTGGDSPVCAEEADALDLVLDEIDRPHAPHLSELLALARATNICEAEVLCDLHRLGYTGETARVLPLVPLARIAWAEGIITRAERHIIDLAARARGVHPGSRAYDLLMRLLEERPSDEFFERSERAMRSMFDRLPPKLREIDEREVLLSCHHVALASQVNPTFDLDGAHVCAEEQSMISRLASRFATKSAATADRTPAH